MDNLEFIDAYFQKSLSPEEQKDFEQKCINDKGFSEEVAFYITARQVLKNELSQTKKKLWQQDNTAVETDTVPMTETEPIAIGPKNGWYKWVKYAAAACLLLAVATIIFERQVSPQQLAANYINDNYTHLSLAMGGVEDELEAAKQAINKKDYQTALAILNSIKNSHPENAEAIKYRGIVYLLTDKYDNALDAFDILSKRTDLFSNRGMFLKAVALMKRNAGNDKATAKQLLETVVEQNMEDSKVAKEWLKRF